MPSDSMNDGSVEKVVSEKRIYEYNSNNSNCKL